MGDPWDSRVSSPDDGEGNRGYRHIRQESNVSASEMLSQPAQQPKDSMSTSHYNDYEPYDHSDEQHASQPSYPSYAYTQPSQPTPSAHHQYYHDDVRDYSQVGRPAQIQSHPGFYIPLFLLYFIDWYYSGGVIQTKDTSSSKSLVIPQPSLAFNNTTWTISNIIIAFLIYHMRTAIGPSSVCIYTRQRFKPLRSGYDLHNQNMVSLTSTIPHFCCMYRFCTLHSSCLAL